MGNQSSIITLISSDRRELYKGDVYRLMSYPIGSLVQFRYDQQWVEKSIWENNKNNEGQKAVVVFRHLSQVDGNKDIPIRYVHIKKVRIDSNTNRMVLTLQAAEFSTGKISDLNTDGDRLVCKKMIYIESEDIKNHWLKAASQLSVYFPKVSFFYIEGLIEKKECPLSDSCSDSFVDMELDKERCDWWYEISPRRQYYLKISAMFNEPKDGLADESMSRLKILDGGSALRCANYDHIPISASDSFYEPIYIGVAETPSLHTKLTLTPALSNNKEIDSSFRSSFGVWIRNSWFTSIANGLLVGFFPLIVASHKVFSGGNSNEALQNNWCGLLGVYVVSAVVGTFAYKQFSRK